MSFPRSVNEVSSSTAEIVSHYSLDTLSTFDSWHDSYYPSVPTLVLENPPPSADDFNFLKFIDRGGFGYVFKVKENRTQNVYALKIMKKDSRSYKQLFNLVKEQTIMRTVSENNLNGRFLELLASWSDTSFLYILMPLYPTSILAETKRCGRLHPKRVKFYMVELVLALEELHKQGIIHRDVKCPNILISSTGHLVLADFGLAHQFPTLPTEEERTAQPYWPYRREDVVQPGTPRRKPDELTHVWQEFGGSPEEMAPEIYLSKHYAYGVDFWSLAVTMYCMLYGHAPWEDPDLETLRLKIIHTPPLFDKDDGVDPVAKDLMARMLHKNPTKRLHIRLIKQHPYFKGVNWEAHQKRKVAAPWTPGGKSTLSSGSPCNVHFEPGLPYHQAGQRNPFPCYDFCSPAFYDTPPSSKGLRSRILRLLTHNFGRQSPRTVSKRMNLLE